MIATPNWWRRVRRAASRYVSRSGAGSPRATTCIGPLQGPPSNSIIGRHSEAFIAAALNGSVMLGMFEREVIWI